jgi:predicted nucleic acid-binding protein
MIVIDGSVLSDALLDDGPKGETARAVLSEDPYWAAPAILRVEVLSVIRGRTLGGKIGTDRASDAVSALSGLAVEQLDPQQLVERSWQLRSNLSAYDAAYVAAAEHLGCPLVTSDARIAKAAGTRCEIQVISPC